MFRFLVKRLPWRGPEVAARIELAGSEGARLAAEYVAARARAYCPVDTGELRRSIEVIGTRGGMRWSVVATAKHARYVEFGTTHHGPRGSYFIPPNPFMRRAFADGRREFPTILRGVMVQALKGQSLGGTFQA